MAALFQRIGTINREHWAFYLMLLFGFLHGLVYIFLVPPWEHYDEPTHFEFAWLIANRLEVPEPGAYDQAMRRELAASMVEHGFFEQRDIHPNLASISKPVWAGISQINQRPLYYALVAVPLRFIQYTDIVFQLRVGRFVSLSLLMITIWAAFQLAKELFPRGHVLRYLIPSTFVFVPGITDMMTAINDDVGATTFFTLFLWAGARIMRRGFSWARLFGLLSSAALCFWAKNTVTIAVALLAIPLLFSLLRGHRRWYAWAIIFLLVQLTTTTMLSWGDAANWYRQVFSDLPSQKMMENAPLGTHAIQIPLHPAEASPRLNQILPPEKSFSLQGQQVTFGAWIWATTPIRVRTPILRDGVKNYYREIQATTEPTYHIIPVQLAPNSQRVQMILSPTDHKVEAPVTVYYDGLILTPGWIEAISPPKFDDQNGLSGSIDGQNFENLLRNPSAEWSWPFVREWTDRFIRAYFPGRPALILAGVLDLEPFAWYYEATARNFSYTFWARFGWGEVALRGYKPYTWIGIVTLLGFAGALIGLFRLRKQINGLLFFFFGTAFLWIWGAAMIRGITSLIAGQIFIPTARYAYPASFITMLILTFGWLELIGAATRYTRLRRRWLLAALLLFFISLDLLSIYSIAAHFYG